ncbi:hypothetical protein D8887_06810 [Streptococcus sanguinis]|uniref:Uncharacterized protein n=1 Tax=Streptococcus sanguinis TaxID=1305 RepID=A0A427Z4D0_STRSA|nr:hypothetical protein D8887_11560 [Streptococcus sanguinis]RSI10140.1 hypothetical protein D8887_06810 [Streptococcus sanguinis]
MTGSMALREWISSMAVLAMIRCLVLMAMTFWMAETVMINLKVALVMII